LTGIRHQYTQITPCQCSSVLSALGHYVQWSVTPGLKLGPGVFAFL